MQRFATTLLAVMALAVMTGAAHAAICSASGTAPTVDGLDVANYAASTGLDKWWVDTARHQGQTITPSSNALLNSITYVIADSQQAAPTKEWRLRVSTITKPDPADPSTWSLNVFHSEDATQDFYWYGADGGQSGQETPNPYMTWTFDTPVLLTGGTEYAVDLGLVSSSSGWSSGIPYTKRTGDEYADGTRYLVSDLDGTGMGNVGGDRVFHADMVVPEPATLALLGLGGLGLIARRRRR